jgi:hypothetical protein
VNDNKRHNGNREAACFLPFLIVYSIHISLPADESNQEVIYENQDDAEGLVIAADCNYRVWPGVFPGDQLDPVG